MLKPNKRFYEVPAFYVANHTALLAHGDDMWWPSHTDFLDFELELELAFVLARPVVDATPEEARAAVGGFLVLNDWSARDVQAAEARHSIFGPVVKSKTFANSIGCDVVTADELPDWQRATGRVRVDGDVWCEGTTAGAAHDIGEALAYASSGERLEAGDVISTGCMPTCCGLELDCWIEPGNVVELEIDGIGTLTNRIREDGTPTTAFGPMTTSQSTSYAPAREPAEKCLAARKGEVGSPTVRDPLAGAPMTTTSQLVTGVDFVSVPTRDLEAAADFYGNTLGLRRFGLHARPALRRVRDAQPDVECDRPGADGHWGSRAQPQPDRPPRRRRRGGACATRGGGVAFMATSSTPASATWPSSPTRMATPSCCTTATRRG